MRKSTTILGVVVIAVAGFVGYAWYVDGRGAIDGGAGDGPLTIAGAPVERGRYLAAAADCVACHTPPGAEEYAGGVAFKLPFGTIYSSNLTPDPDAGIGAWTDDEFLRAVRSGVGRGGRHLYPAHPYTSYAAMARNDVLAIRAYLKTLPPSSAKVQSSELRFPYSQRGLLPLWNVIFLDGQRFEADPGHDEAWNRGAYLANALGHCGECHTPRNVAYAPDASRALTGAVTRGWKAYDIAPDETGIGAWTEAALDEYLATGHASGHGSAAGPMKEVVEYSTAKLSAVDRKALVAYLLAGGAGARTPAGKRAAAAPVVAVASAGMGATLYAGTCAGCHSLDPKAATGPYSDLTGARTVRDPQGTNLLKLLAEESSHGVGVGTTMPGFGRGYSDTERAALANYVLAQWGRLPPALTPADAMSARTGD